MKLRKNYQRIIFIFIILICLEYSKCSIDCGNSFCTSDGLSCLNAGTNICDPNCKPKYGSSTCHDCTGISSGDYYTIGQDGTCLIDQCIGDKIVEKANDKECTSQIVNPSGSLYQVGELGEYYTIIVDTTNLHDCTSNICTCKHYYFIESIYGKKKYTCFSNLDDYSSSNYKYYTYQLNYD